MSFGRQSGIWIKILLLWTYPREIIEQAYQTECSKIFVKMLILVKILE